jgi:DNA topoisomerase VI subunit B
MNDAANGGNSNGPILQRETFSYSRNREYFERAELQTMTGQSADEFPAVVVKELLDNALDAAEMAGVVPIIKFNVWRRRHDVIIVIKDNGAGIPVEAVAGILDLNARHSDKAAYRSPTRGQQGNATKTIVGIPYALGSRQPLVIEAQGKKHVIRPHIDPGGNVRVDHDTRDVDDQGGTRVALSLPALACDDFDPKHWARAFALFNPHAFIHFADRPTSSLLANGDPDEMPKMYKRSYRATVEYPGKDWSKFEPRDLIPVQWYDLDSFTRLIFAHVGKARQGGRDWTLREFIVQFPKFRRVGVVKAITDQFPQIDRLSDFDKHRDQVSRLLELMQKESRAPKPETLGLIGPEHFTRRFQTWFGLKRFWYKKTAGIVGNVPFVFEVAIAHTLRDGGFFHGVNFSPTFEDPFGGGDNQLWGGKVHAYSALGFLGRAHVLKTGEPDEVPFPTAAAIHLITPVTQPLDKGKSKLVIPRAVLDDVALTLWKASKELYQEGERRKRDALAQERRDRQQEILAKEDAKDEEFTKIMDEVIPRALADATGDYTYRVSVHFVFYSARRISQEYTDVILKKDYFEQKLFPPWQAKHPEIDKWVYRPPRGILYEPHSRKVLHLGTRDVEEYTFPHHLYNKILFVEKDGIWDILEKARIAEKFDLAIVSGAGFATEALRVIFRKADKDWKCKLFSFTDADINGKNIARILGAPTPRMPGHRAEVEHLGLTLEEGLRLGLQVEEFNRTKALPKTVDFTPLELEYFTGRYVGPNAKNKKQWICRRIELNAFTAPQLIAYIEEKLAVATGKVIPPKKALPNLVDPIYKAKLTEIFRDEIDARLDLDTVIQGLTDQFCKANPLEVTPDNITAAFKKNPYLSWKDAVGKQIKGLLDEKNEDLGQAIDAALRSVLEGGEAT